MTPVVAALPLRELLNGPTRAVTVLARFPHAAYLQVDADAEPPPVVAVVTSDGIAHPNALVLTRPASARPLASVHPGAVAAIGDGVLRLDGEEHHPVRWWSPVPALAPVDAAVLAASSSRLSSHLDATTPPLPQDLASRLGSVREALAAGRVRTATAAARDLVGRGPGLTPAGDDVLAGLLAAVSALAPIITPSVDELRHVGDELRHMVDELRHMVDELAATILADAAGRTTAISRELLKQAATGAVLAPAGRLLHALVHTGSTGEQRLIAAADELLAVGSTSGRDLAVGLQTGATLVARAAAGVAAGVAAGPDRTAAAAVVAPTAA